jgi:hypothetical protein
MGLGIRALDGAMVALLATQSRTGEYHSVCRPAAANASRERTEARPLISDQIGPAGSLEDLRETVG